MRQKLQDAAKSLAVYVLPLRASRTFIEKSDRTPNRAAQINEDDLARVILFGGGRNTDHAAAISLPMFPSSGLEHLLGATIEKPTCLRVLYPHGSPNIDVVSETKTYHSLLLQSLWSENHVMREQGPETFQRTHKPLYITTYHFNPTGPFLTQTSKEQLATTLYKVSASISREFLMIIGVKALHYQEPAETQQVLAVKLKSMKYSRHARPESGSLENWQCEDVNGWVFNSKRIKQSAWNGS